MRLPDYSGPFAVGAIDLEIPAREPRTFGAQYVSNHEINPPTSSKHKLHLHKPKLSSHHLGDPSASSSPLASSKAPSHGGRAKQVADNARQKAKARADDGGEDHDTNDQLDQHCVEDNNVDANAGQGSYDKDINEKEKQEDQWKDWNPLSGGAKTSTLHFATVLFTIFYPSSVKPNERKRYSELAWIGRPKKRGFAALLSYLGHYGAFAMPAAPAVISLVRARIPALAGAPLADPSSNMARAPPPNDKVEMGNFGGQPPAFPVMFFSHGLAGNRLTYSQFCGELASHGIVVVALEHRDGSGLASMVRTPLSFASPDQADAITKEIGTENPSKGRASRGPRNLQVKYLPFEKIGLRSFAEDPDKRETGLRLAQIAMRQAELREALHVVQQIAAGQGEEIAKQSTRSFTGKLAQVSKKDRAARRKRAQQDVGMLKEWKGKLDIDFPALCGHSFGGATVLEMQRKAAADTSKGDRQHNDETQEKHGHSSETRVENESKSPFPYAIALDPWVDPVLWKGDDGEKKENGERDSRPVQGPIYVFNSETFTIWHEHFAKLKRMLHDSLEEQGFEGDGNKHGWLMTLAGCQHLDFSDLPLILPHVFRSTVGPRKTIAIFTRAAYTQMGLVRQRRRDCQDLPGVKSKDVWPDGESRGERKERVKQEYTDDMQHGVESHLTTKVDRAEWNEGHGVEMGGKGPALAQVWTHRSGSEQAKSSAENSTGNNSESGLSDDARNLEGRNTANQAAHSASSTSYTTADEHEEAKDRENAASTRLRNSQHERKERVRRMRIIQERRERGLHARIAQRTPEGDVKGIAADKKEYTSREEEEEALAAIDFSDKPSDICGDPDAGAVYDSLSDLVSNLDYKKVKIHSLMAFLFRAKGLRPGLDQPGRVLVHEI